MQGVLSHNVNVIVGQLVTVLGLTGTKQERTHDRVHTTQIQMFPLLERERANRGSVLIDDCAVTTYQCRFVI